MSKLPDDPLSNCLANGGKTYAHEWKLNLLLHLSNPKVVSTMAPIEMVGSQSFQLNVMKEILRNEGYVTHNLIVYSV